MCCIMRKMLAVGHLRHDGASQGLRFNGDNYMPHRAASTTNAQVQRHACSAGLRHRSEDSSPPSRGADNSL